MKKTIFMMTFAAAVMLMSSCASKKELVACQEENKTLQANYTDTKEQLAASKARVASLEQQLAQEEKANKALQNALDKVSRMPARIMCLSTSWLTRLMSRTSISAILLR